MARAPDRSIHFLGDSAGANTAAAAFRALASRMGLPWKAVSIEFPSAAASEVASLVPALADESRAIVFLNLEESAAAARALAMSPNTRIEAWSVDTKEMAALEQHLSSLVAQLLGGTAAPPAGPEPAPFKKAAPPKKVHTVRLGRETKGRRGKGVTIISDLPVCGAALDVLASKLKERCGTGGTVKDGQIEIQGDQRDRLTVELEKLGFKVKRVGG